MTMTKMIVVADNCDDDERNDGGSVQDIKNETCLQLWFC